MMERKKDEGMKNELKEEKIKTKPQFFKRSYIMHRFPPLLGLETMPLDSQAYSLAQATPVAFVYCIDYIRKCLVIG